MEIRWIIFWVAVLLVTLIEIGYEHGLATTVTLIISIVAYVMTVRHFPYQWFLDYWYLLVLYFPVGVLWSFKMWADKIKKSRDEYEEIKIRWGKKDALGKKTWQGGWESYLRSRNFEIPELDRYKGDIVCWIAYWPWSVVVYLLKDVVREFCEWAITHLRMVYERIAERYLGDIIKKGE